MRRARTIAMLVVLGTFAVAGCGSGYDSPGTGNPGGTSPATTPAPQSAGSGGY